MTTDVTNLHGLVVLDFSGTLSPGAAGFAAPGRLQAELDRAGLVDLGIESPEVFWDRLVAPTWDQGSTTTAGYVTVLSAAAVEHLAATRPTVDPDAVRRSVQAFADRYFDASTIDPAWRPWLHRLVALDDVRVVVATDHYAEATAHVLAQLRTLGVEATAVTAAAWATRAVVLVANSADLGHHKQDRPFWQPVRAVVGAVERVVVVDDFGAGEVAGDAYADPATIRRRRRRTTQLLAEVFDAHVRTVSCPGAVDGEASGAIDRAAEAALRLVTTPGG